MDARVSVYLTDTSQHKGVQEHEGVHVSKYVRCDITIQALLLFIVNKEKVKISY